MLKRLFFITVLYVLSTQISFAQSDTIYVYGPGGPFPPLHEVSQKFEKENNVKVIITKGPFKNWQKEAEYNADLIYSGSEHMMTDFENAFSEQIIPELTYPLYRRYSGLIVRKGNPKKIKKLEDLQRQGLKIMVVNGSGLTGVWEDMLSNLSDMEVFRKIRQNIVIFANNSGQAEKIWKEQKEIDVWISWNIWQQNNPEISEFIDVRKKYTIKRDVGMTLTIKGNKNDKAKEFYEFLKTKEAHKIFRKHGWE